MTKKAEKWKTADILELSPIQLLDRISVDGNFVLLHTSNNSLFLK